MLSVNDIKRFYDNIQFPGHYKMRELDHHIPYVQNPYLKLIDTSIASTNPRTVLDIGCGTGLITNLFAKKYPTIKFTGLDFSNSVRYANKFAINNNLMNVNYIQKSWLDFDTSKTYDLVICQGVLHHIPHFRSAIRKLHDVVPPGGILVLGVYHPWGKILKKYVNIKYNSQTLYMDQEKNPYENSFTDKEIRKYFYKFNFLDVYPVILKKVTSIPALFNSRNGGLVTYVLQRKGQITC